MLGKYAFVSNIFSHLKTMFKFCFNFYSYKNVFSFNLNHTFYSLIKNVLKQT